MTQTSLLSLLAGNTIVATLLAIVALIAARNAKPALAHVAWLLVLVKLLTPPVVRVPIWESGQTEPPTRVITPAPPASAKFERQASTALPVTSAAVADNESGDAATPATAAPQTRSSPIASAAIITAVWAAGAFFLTTISVARIHRFRRMLRDATPADALLQDEIAALAARIGVRRPPLTLVSSHRISPLIWFIGLARPRLILPVELLRSLSREEREGVIAHELAHLRRRDHWVRLIELPAAILLWFHPLVWLARRGLRDAEEACCDAWAIATLSEDRRRSYADALVSTLELVARQQRLPAGTTGLGQLSTLRRRLTMIVTGSPAKTLSTRARLAVAALVALALFVPATAQVSSPPAAVVAEIPADAIRVKAGDSIQQAIDTAKPGATIVVAAGEFSESISINKPVTLVGAGWERTIVGLTKVGALTQQQKDDFFKRLDATSDPEERARIAMQLAAVMQTPTLTIANVHDVAIRGLRFRGPAMKMVGNRLTADTLVQIDNATVAIDNVSIIGPFSNGVTIVNGSDVTISNSLVAGLWGTGVQVVSAKLHLTDSDLRNCYSRCLTIAGEGSVIERNRISGSAWHGIRYDNCSPTITGNLIYGNARSGIYASGKTAAKVTGNVFWRNEMDGMSCWTANADEVVGNTFVDNVREGIAVLGGSTTLLKNNIFAGSPVAIDCNAIGGESPTVLGSPRLESNVFWNNPEAFKIGQDAKPLPAGNDTIDPKVVAAASADFSLAADSPARQRGAGALNPLAATGTFPITPEEQAMIPDGLTRDYQAWKK